MVINKKICPAGLKNNPNKQLRSISFITIHTTGNYSATATAQSHANYQYNGSGGNQTSWHYTVDKDDIWQSFEDNQSCWHTGNSEGNSTSIGIEICVNNREFFNQACENTAWLVSELMKKYNLNIDKIVQHNHWANKNCPAELRSGSWGITWNEFIELIHHHANKSTATTEEQLDVKMAIDILVKHNVIASPEYWLNNYTKLQYLDQLLINMAIRISSE